ARALRDRMMATVHEYRPAHGGSDGPGARGGPHAPDGRDGGDAGWGCFLSGGTDSSSIVSILARQKHRGRVQSFTIGFAEARYDEAHFARAAADACGADGTFERVSDERAQ